MGSPFQFRSDFHTHTIDPFPSSPQLLAALAGAVRLRAPQLEPQGVANVLWGAARLGDKEVFQEAVR
jgi:hypothetical protein